MTHNLIDLTIEGFRPLTAVFDARSQSASHRRQSRLPRADGVIMGYAHFGKHLMSGFTSQRKQSLRSRLL